MRCLCGSNRNFDECCGPFIGGEKNAPTAEALMRSRYTAYTRQDIDYIARTLAPEALAGFDAREAKAWAAEVDWRGLKSLSTEKGLARDTEGAVEFVATYRQQGATIAHHEFSRFRKTDAGEWRFVEGDTRTLKGAEARREAPKVGRNDPCPCGSGKKHKKCCGANT
jgi:SEC-C motif-containing protein